MRTYDITLTISADLPVWPGDPAVRLTTKSHLSRDKTHNVRLTAIEMGSHTGTHVDPPFHFLPDGAKVDALPLAPFLLAFAPCILHLAPCALLVASWRRARPELPAQADSDHHAFCHGRHGPGLPLAGL